MEITAFIFPTGCTINIITFVTTRMITFPANGLSPEQTRALKKVEVAMGSNVLPYAELPSNFYEFEDAVFFTHAYVATKALPKVPNQRWNQSRSRVTLLDTDSVFELTFYKLRSTMTNKSKRKTTLAPETSEVSGSKVWVFHLTKGEKIVTYIWCEKRSQDTNVERPGCIENLTVADFSFLSPFVTEDLALEFGWNKYIADEWLSS